MKRLISLLLLLLPLTSLAQTRIQMQEENGVYKIPCEVNGLRMKFIFDTGASNVNISLTEAKFMLENDYISSDDILGTATSQIADGSIVENTIIRLKEIKIADIILKDVTATVTHSMSAPLLLGQSAIQKLGAIQIEGNELIILAHNTTKSDEEIDQMFEEAENFYNNKLYTAASKKYQELYDLGVLSDYGISLLARSYYMIDDYNKAIVYYNKIKDFSDFSNSGKYLYYQALGFCYYRLKDYDNAIYNFEIQSKYANDNDDNYDDCKIALAIAYWVNNNYYKTITIYEELLHRYLNKKKLDISYAIDLMEKGKLDDDKIEKYLFEVAYHKYYKYIYEKDEYNATKNYEKIVDLARKGNKYAIEHVIGK